MLYLQAGNNNTLWVSQNKLILIFIGIIKSKTGKKMNLTKDKNVSGDVVEAQELTKMFGEEAGCQFSDPAGATRLHFWFYRSKRLRKDDNGPHVDRDP